MTWIIGSNTFLGYCYAFSDIKVSWGNEEHDCLKKFYIINNNLGVGFAGSVSLGFKMVESIKKYVQDLPSNKSCQPEYIISSWKRHAMRIFNESSKTEQRNKCQLMFLGVSPQYKINLGDLQSFPKTIVAKMSSPLFTPYCPKNLEIIDIGSGSSVKEYRNLLDGINKDLNSILSFANYRDRGMSLIMQIQISDLLKRVPKFGISCHMHVTIANSNGLQIFKNDIESEDKSQTLKMPEIAESNEEFLRYCKLNNKRAAAAKT